MFEARLHFEIALGEARHSQVRRVGLVDRKRCSDAQANFHEPAFGWNRKALDENPIGATHRDEHGVSALLHSDLSVRGAHFAFSCKSGLARFSVHPKGDARYYATRRQLDLSSRFTLVPLMVVAKLHGPLQISPAFVRLRKTI